MNFIHIADLHFSKAREKECSIVLDQIIEHIEKSPAYLLIAGDFWDSSINVGETFTKAMSYIKKLLSLTKVFILYGTPTHESSSSLEPFRLLGANVYRVNTYEDFGDWDLIAIPEPRKVDYISKTSKDKNVNQAIAEEVDSFLKTIPKKTKPRIVMYHGEVKSVTYPNGIPCSSPYGLSKEQLKLLNADYYALGHIHSDLEVFTNCRYSGSCFPKDFGETLNCGMNIIEIGDIND